MNFAPYRRRPLPREIIALLVLAALKAIDFPHDNGHYSNYKIDIVSSFNSMGYIEIIMRFVRGSRRDIVMKTVLIFAGIIIPRGSLVTKIFLSRRVMDGHFFALVYTSQRVDFGRFFLLCDFASSREVN